MYPQSFARSVDDYQTMTENEHILKRSDMYTGSNEYVLRKSPIFNIQTNSVETKNIYTPFTMDNIFREPLNNIGDNVNTSREHNINPRDVQIYIYSDHVKMVNFGLGIPVQTKQFKLDNNEIITDWIPTRIFSKTRTSTNYGDNRSTSGRNGFGVTLTGVFSKRFEIQLSDSINTFSQIWTDNLQVVYDPKIEPDQNQSVYTSVTFYPDFLKMGYYSENFTQNDINLFCLHCLDLSYYTGIEVHIMIDAIDLEIEIKKYIKFDVSNAFHYLEYYTNSQISTKYIHYTDRDIPPITYDVKIDSEKQTFNLNFELLIADSPGAPIFVTLVNGIRSIDGIQINIIYDLLPTSGYKYKSHKARIFHHLAVILKVTLINPSSEGQTKSKLTGPKFKLELPDSAKFDDWMFTREIELIKKDDNIGKLSLLNSNKTGNINEYLKRGCKDAYYAGKQSHRCVLALSEGKSAAIYPEQYIDSISEGRRTWGILPLKGKILNIRKAFRKACIKGNFDKICENKEIGAIVTFLNLVFGLEYISNSEFASLRYHRVICFFDSDNDGFHIMMLLLNFFDFFFPHLLNRKGFISFYATPVVKLSRKDEVLHRFYMNHHFEMFMQNEKVGDNNLSNDDILSDNNLSIEYFKGLGRSESSDIEDNMNHEKIINFYYSPTSREMIEMIMGKSPSARKEWLTTDIPNINYIEQIEDISVFIDVNVKSYSIESIIRSTPGLDGLKESQRMLLFTMLEDTNYSKSGKIRKLPSLAAMTSYLRDYHHGEKSLIDTAALMAQDFPVSTNLKHFIPKGTYGTRSDKSSIPQPRYLEVKDNPLISKIYRYEDKSINTEKLLYPIIPTILVNGAVGIGTGWSTFVPGFKLDDILNSTIEIVSFLNSKLEKDDYKMGSEINIIEKNKINIMDAINIIPHCRGYLGNILFGSTEKESIDKHRYYIRDRTIEFDNFVQYVIYSGVCNAVDPYTYVITEIPPKFTFNRYFKHIISLREKGIIDDIIDDGKSKYIYLTIKFNMGFINNLGDFNIIIKEVTKTLMLHQNVTLDNMNILDENNNIKNYHSVEHIFVRYILFRTNAYSIRSSHNLDEYNDRIKILKGKLRFIEYVNTNKINISKLNKNEIYAYSEQFDIDKKIIKSLRLVERSIDNVQKLKDRITALELKCFELQDGTENCFVVWLRELYELRRHIQKYPKQV